MTYLFKKRLSFIRSYLPANANIRELDDVTIRTLRDFKMWPRLTILYMKNYRTTFLRIYKRLHWTKYSQAIYIYFTLHFTFENKQDMLFLMVRNEFVAIFNDEFALYPIKRETTRRIIKWLFLNLETRKIV